MTLTLDDLEFENGHLVKVRGMWPEYESGGRLIDIVRELAVLCANLAAESSTESSRSKDVADLQELAALIGAKFTPHEQGDELPPAKEDIVDRLRNRMVFGLYWDFAREAADEIVRLRTAAALAHAAGMAQAAKWHEDRVLAIRADPASYKYDAISRRAWQASNFHEQSADAIRKLIGEAQSTPVDEVSAGSDATATETILAAALRPAEPEEIAAAWATWHSRHGGKFSPGPAFVEAINAAFKARAAKEGK